MRLLIRPAVLIGTLAAVIGLGFGRARDQKIERYSGPRPVPGAPMAVGELPTLSPDSAVAIVFGDNRPGHLLLTRRFGAREVYEALESRHPRALVWGLLNVPLAAVQAFYPNFYGLRDIWSQFVTHRFTGGNQPGVIRALERNPDVDLMINTGDVVIDGRRGGLWDDFQRRYAALRTRAPFLIAPGNHEALWSPIARANWDLVVRPPDAPLHYWYTAELGGGLARFVFLDSNVLVDPRGHLPDSLEERLAGAEFAWADSVLAAPARWKFLVMHHPIVTSGHHLDQWTEAEEHRTPDRRVALLDLIRRRGVTAVFVGHEHLYQRAYLVHPDGFGFWQVTTGGGGSPLHYVSDHDREQARHQSLPDSTTIASMPPEHSLYHYCRLVLRPGAPGVELRVYAVDLAGRDSLIDAVDLGAPPPAPASLAGWVPGR